jgi:hypothetical protein
VIASVRELSHWTLPATGVGALLGIIGLCQRSVRGAGKLWPAAGLLLNLGVAWTMVFQPWVIGVVPPGSAADLMVLKKLTAIPQGTHDANAARSVGSGEWVDAGNAVQKDDVRLVVTSATVKPLTYTDEKGKKITTKEKYLFVELRLSNMAVNHPVDYVSWGEAGSTAARPVLQDHMGKQYELKTFPPAMQIPGHVAKATVGPWKAVQDVLVFEPPVPNMDFFRLELPCTAFGGSDTFRLEIPNHMITRLSGQTR